MKTPLESRKIMYWHWRRSLQNYDQKYLPLLDQREAILLRGGPEYLFFPSSFFLRLLFFNILSYPSFSIAQRGHFLGLLNELFGGEPLQQVLKYFSSVRGNLFIFFFHRSTEGMALEVFSFSRLQVSQYRACVSIPVLSFSIFSFLLLHLDHSCTDYYFVFCVFSLVSYLPILAWMPTATSSYKPCNSLGPVSSVRYQ